MVTFKGSSCDLGCRGTRAAINPIAKGIADGLFCFTVILFIGHILMDPFSSDTILGVFILIMGLLLSASVFLIRLGFAVLKLPADELSQIEIKHSEQKAILRFLLVRKR